MTFETHWHFQGHPVFKSQDSNCVYTFSWVSAAACPEDWEFSTSTTPFPPTGTTKKISSQDCKVQDFLTGKIIDLSVLSGAAVTSSDGSFSVAVCSNFDCGAVSSAVCSASTSYGQYLYKPQYDENVGVSITYDSGDTCTNHPDQTFRSVIEFTCDPTADQSVPELRSKDDCTVYFEWPTQAVCEEPPQVECIVKDSDGNEFDFTPLIREGDEPNWQVTSPYGETFQINICDSLTGLKKNDRCAGSAACMTIQPPEDSGAPESYPLGIASSAPKVYGGGFIHLNYNSLPTLPSDFNPCQDPTGNTLPSIQIAFFCRRGDDGEPVFVSKSPDCVYNFNWYTSAACPTETIVGENCKVTDDNGITYDMTPLKANDYVALDETGLNGYHFAVCRQLHYSACTSADPTTIGACLTSNQGTTEIGVAISNLLFTQGVLTLNYASTTQCPTKPGSTYSTVIEFYCDPKAVYAIESFEEITEACVISIGVATSYACASLPVDCTTFDPVRGTEYDLTPLMRDDANWEVLGSKIDSAFLINVCRPLVDTIDNNCETDSGVCQVNDIRKTSYNLGHVASPVVDKGVLKIVYENGDTTGCGSARTTTVTFICDKNAGSEAFPLGQPVFVGESTKCNYDINWKTRVACPLTSVTSQTCAITDPITNIVFNLTGLAVASVSDPRGGMNYKISPCGPLPDGCAGDNKAGICQYTKDGTFSLGSRDFLEYDEGLSMSFSGGTGCHSNAFKRSSLITFQCSSTVRIVLHRKFIIF